MRDAGHPPLHNRLLSTLTGVSVKEPLRLVMPLEIPVLRIFTKKCGGIEALVDGFKMQSPHMDICFFPSTLLLLLVKSWFLVSERNVVIDPQPSPVAQKVVVHTHRRGRQIAAVFKGFSNSSCHLKWCSLVDTPVHRCQNSSFADLCKWPLQVTNEYSYLATR